MSMGTLRVSGVIHMKIRMRLMDYSSNEDYHRNVRIDY